MRKCLSIFVLFVVFCLQASPLNTNAKMKATYIYNFAVNTNWPASKKSGDFKIGVYGDDSDLVSSLSIIQGRKIGSQVANVSVVNNLSNVNAYHILYVTHHRQTEVNKIVAQLKGHNVLLIVEGRGLLGSHLRGYCIGFYPVNNRWVFDINSKSLESQGLLVTSKLQNLANKVTQD